MHMLQIAWTVIMFIASRKTWKKRDEEHQVHSIKRPSEFQFWLDQISLLFAILFIINGPLLFLPACRGSLLNTFLGVRYGVAIKWHRCVLS
jgi:hypothetical protein